MKTTKIVAGVFGTTTILITMLIIIGCGLVLWLFSSFLSCGIKISQEIYSPNGKYKVVVFRRDCEITITNFETHISVIKSDAVLGNQRGNIFQAYGDPDKYSIKAIWKDDQHIIIEHNVKSTPVVVKNKIGNIEIQYIKNTEGMRPKFIQEQSLHSGR
jgi:hypothetical protein